MIRHLVQRGKAWLIVAALAAAAGPAMGYVVSYFPDVTKAQAEANPSRWIYVDLTQAAHKFYIQLKYEDGTLCWHRRAIWPTIVALKAQRNTPGYDEFVVGYWQRPMPLIFKLQGGEIPTWSYVGGEGTYVWKRAVFGGGWAWLQAGPVGGGWWQTANHSFKSPVLHRQNNWETWSGMYHTVYQYKGTGLQNIGNLANGCHNSFTIHHDYVATHRYLVDLFYWYISPSGSVELLPCAVQPSGSTYTQVQTLMEGLVQIRPQGSSYDDRMCYEPGNDADLDVYVPKHFFVGLENWALSAQQHPEFISYGNGSWAAESSTFTQNYWQNMATRDVVADTPMFWALNNYYAGVDPMDGASVYYKGYSLYHKDILHYLSSDPFTSGSGGPYAPPGWIQYDHRPYYDKSVTDLGATARVYDMGRTGQGNDPSGGTATVPGLRYRGNNQDLTINNWLWYLLDKSWWDNYPRLGTNNAVTSLNSAYVGIIPNRTWHNIGGGMTLDWTNNNSNVGRSTILLTTAPNIHKIRPKWVRYWYGKAHWATTYGTYECEY